MRPRSLTTRLASLHGYREHEGFAFTSYTASNAVKNRYGLRFRPAFGKTHGQRYSAGLSLRIPCQEFKQGNTLCGAFRFPRAPLTIGGVAVANSCSGTEGDDATSIENYL